MEKHYKELVVELKNNIPEQTIKKRTSLPLEEAQKTQTVEQETFVTAPKTTEVAITSTDETVDAAEKKQDENAAEHQKFTVDDPPTVIMDGMTVGAFAKIVKNLRDKNLFLMGIINEEELLFERQQSEIKQKLAVYEEQVAKMKANKKHLDE